MMSSWSKQVGIGQSENCGCRHDRLFLVLMILRRGRRELQGLKKALSNSADMIACE
jgi:putative protein kinase ArgK-like GTPase of G3E family